MQQKPEVNSLVQKRLELVQQYHKERAKLAESEARVRKMIADVVEVEAQILKKGGQIAAICW